MCDTWESGTKQILSYQFRAEVTKSRLCFLNVRKLCGSISICHQNELSSADHSSLQWGRTGNKRQQSKSASRCIWVLHSSRQQLNIFGLTIRTAPPFPLFFTSVMTRTLSGPYSLVYCNATWRNNGTGQSLFFCNWMSNTFPAKKEKKNHLSGFVFAAIIDDNDLIGKRGVIFLWERSGGI